jgi:hypothetical protein
MSERASAESEKVWIDTAVNPRTGRDPSPTDEAGCFRLPARGQGRLDGDR